MKIVIQGAREHNLQGVSLEFGEGLTVVSGVSGSGKTSLVFDTLYHEARRRFLEIFSLGSSGTRLAPANVESISGLGPAISVGQNLLNRNPNSTLATSSGLHPFLRLLFARFGERACLACGATISAYTEDEIVERLLVLSEEKHLRVYALLLNGVHGSHQTLIALLVEQFGDQALVVDGNPYRPESQPLDPHSPHSIDLLITQP